MRSRRRFLKSIAAGAALPLADASFAGGAYAYGRTSVAADAYLGEVRVETEVIADEVFTEGPAVHADGRVFFTNVPASTILIWDPKTQTTSVFRENSHGANGLLFDPQGRLLACEGEAGRITRTDLETGAIEVLADRFDGRPFQAPNDLTLDAEGRVYFSSRSGGEVPADVNPKGVYRIDPDGRVHPLLREPDVHLPNGLALSPDGHTLYLIDADADVGRNRHLRAYDLRPDGTLTNGRTLVDFYPGRSGDGMAVDVRGNLYVAAGLHARRGTSETLDTRPGIHVFSPSGERLAYAETPVDTVTNCTFGGSDGRTLYVTCGPLLLSLRTEIRGANERMNGGKKG